MEVVIVIFFLSSPHSILSGYARWTMGEGEQKNGRPDRDVWRGK